MTEMNERLKRIEKKIDILSAGHGALRVEVAAGMADLRGRVKALEEGRRSGMSLLASAVVVTMASFLNFFLGLMLADL